MNVNVGFFGLLGLLFVGLKLADYIDWSWWWVTAPFWGPVAAAMTLFALFGAIGLLIAKKG